MNFSSILKNFAFVLLPVMLVVGAGCSDQDRPLFERLHSDHTGILFSNTIAENDTLNILNQEYIYNGGAVAVGDFNNDGLHDLYFTANMVSNRLYLNKGSIQFEDITEKAGVTGEGKWCSGATVVDINSDGWQDIYVSVTLNKNPFSRRNLLYINNGLNEDGIPTFTESAARFGLDDDGHTHNAASLEIFEKVPSPLFR